MTTGRAQSTSLFKSDVAFVTRVLQQLHGRYQYGSICRDLAFPFTTRSRNKLHVFMFSFPQSHNVGVYYCQIFLIDLLSSLISAGRMSWTFPTALVITRFAIPFRSKQVFAQVAGVSNSHANLFLDAKDSVGRIRVCGRPILGFEAQSILG